MATERSQLRDLLLKILAELPVPYCDVAVDENLLWKEPDGTWKVVLQVVDSKVRNFMELNYKPKVISRAHDRSGFQLSFLLFIPLMSG